MKKLKVTALGDSITKGVVLTDQDRYTVTQQSFMDMVGEKLDMDIVNCGKFGSTVSMVTRLSADTLKTYRKAITHLLSMEAMIATSTG